MRRIPDGEVAIRLAGDVLAIGAHEINGYVFYTRLMLADLFEDLTRRDDFKTDSSDPASHISSRAFSGRAPDRSAELWRISLR